MALFAARCPVDDRERTWVDDSLGWFRDQFGDASLTAPVILPTRDYFPPPFDGTDDDVRSLVTRVAGYMGVRAALTLRFTSDLDQARNLQTGFGGPRRASGAAGTYSGHDGRPVLTLDRSNVAKPERLVAVIAHELAHVRLLGEERIPSDRADQEPLTDLLTVFFGLGIFNANSARDFSQHSGGWQTQRLGYLTEQLFGYGLARWATLREESDPPWAKYLDTNPRTYMKQGLRYLHRR